mgnify:CR=1 FL=1
MDSKLQIISGAFRGKKLKIPLCARPTQNRARVAVFNMLTGILLNDDIMIWDAFAGAGAFGLECLSRYQNARVLFTDIATESVKCIRDNIDALNVGARATVKQTDAMSVVAHNSADIDLVFLDPPYADAELGVAFVKRFFAHAKSGAIVVWEQDDTVSILPDMRDVNVLRDKKYGRARFLILQKQ